MDKDKIIMPPVKGYRVSVIFHKATAIGDVWVATLTNPSDRGLVGYGTTWIEALKALTRKLESPLSRTELECEEGGQA